MSLDFPASGEALWALYDQTGIRPEYLLPVLYSESGFRPDVVNSLGYTGINQASTAMLASYGTSSADYATWPASQQIQRVVTPEYANIQNQLGVAIRSGTKAYQLNFLPATLSTAGSLDSVLATEGNTNEYGAGNVYGANAGFDYQHKGTITVGDLAHFVAKAAANPTVQSAISQTYALRPSETMQDPVYGTDFGGNTAPTFNPKSLVIVAGAGFLLYTYLTGDLQRAFARVRPKLRRVPVLGAFA